MMRSVCLLAALVSAISASVVPFRLNFPEGQQPSLRSIANCAGHEDDILTVIGGSSPDEICMPGTMVMDVNTLLKEDLPEDLIFDLKLQKLEPFPMTVPCLNGIGSCPYELCPMIEQNDEVLCPHFPENQPCKCPLFAGTWDMKNVDVPVPDMGPILGKVMEGKYEAVATLYGKSNKDKVLGCFALNFAIKRPRHGTHPWQSYGGQIRGRRHLVRQ